MMLPPDGSHHCSRRQLLGGLALAFTAVPPSSFSLMVGALRSEKPHTFDWGDGLQIQLSGDALFHLEEHSGERRLQLARGDAAILSAAPAGLHGALQPPLRVVMTDGEVMPLGSRCLVSCRSGRSTVTVWEGTVQMRQGDSGPLHTVRAGDRWPAG